MKGTFALFTAILTVGAATLTTRAEDYELLRGKAELLAGQAQDLYQDSCRKGSGYYGAVYQYYFSLIHASGTNLLARSASPANERLMRSYVDLVGKDYEAYTKYENAVEMAGATGNLKGNAGARHRAKRRINAEKLGEKELDAAIRRWERFVGEVKRSQPRKDVK